VYDRILGQKIYPPPFDYRANTPSVKGSIQEQQLAGGSISPSGRCMAFESDALGPDPWPYHTDRQIYGYDVATGKRTLVSVSSAGQPAARYSDSVGPALSGNGRYVAFWSSASNLVPGDTNNCTDVFLHDRDADGNGIFDEPAPGQTKTIRIYDAQGSSSY